MSVMQIIRNRDDQEPQTFIEEPSFSNNFKKTNQTELLVSNGTNILDLQICPEREESKLHRYNNSNNDDNYNFSTFKQINASCQLTEIPDVIFDLKYLNVLDLSNNSLVSLPEGFGNLCNLITLKLSGNKLSSLPKSLLHIQQLNFLDISCNKFSEVPDVLYCGLTILRILDLSSNEITKFNDPPGCLNKLVVLGLSDNFFQELPVWIFNSLCKLKCLDISHNQLNISAEHIKYCSTGAVESLHSLNIKNCNFSLENIQIISLFKNLKVLHLGNKKNLNKKLKGKNYMGNLKTEIFKIFIEIKELYLTNVLIAALPTDFDCLKNIEILDLSGNLLSWLPECFCGLSNLKVLNLAANQLLFLPDSIGNLFNLVQIHLENNKLNSIPESFSNLNNLEFADFYNNQIEKLNPNIFKGKNLKGIDLELNCLKFNFSEYFVDVDEIRVLYNHLKDCFRKHFSYTSNRFDLQSVKLNESLDEMSSDSHSVCTRCSTSSFESELSSYVEDLSINIPQQSLDEDEDWEKTDSCQIEEDDFFDPNEVDLVQQHINKWNLNFRNNYCPADYHVPSVMKTYIQNFRLASQNDTVQEDTPLILPHLLPLKTILLMSNMLFNATHNFLNEKSGIVLSMKKH